MKRLITAIKISLVILSFYSCSEIEYSRAERIAIEGRILDESRKPIANIPIEVFAIHKCSSLF
ncbi:MAG: hypothetical protein RLZZ546_767, partial [Bacteroidota bacterium]